MENIVTKSDLLPIRIGIDVGSTTVKVAILDDNDKILYGDYQRHRADIRSTIITVVNRALDFLEKEVEDGSSRTVTAKVTGSGGLSVSGWLNIPFIQEVIAATTSVKKHLLKKKCDKNEVSVGRDGSVSDLCQQNDNGKQSFSSGQAEGIGEPGTLTRSGKAIPD